MNKIRSLLLTFSLAAIVWSCGDAGFGFDVAAELPIEAAETVIPIPGTGLPFDVDPEQLSFNYELEDVDGFSDALQELRDNRDNVQIFLVGIAYQIDGVNDTGDTYNESVPVEEVRMDFNLSSGVETLAITFPNGILQDVQKTDLNISGLKTLFESEIENTEGLSLDFILDIGTFTTEATPNQLDFNVTIYFDVAVRVSGIK